jgi:hypothetical protein
LIALLVGVNLLISLMILFSPVDAGRRIVANLPGTFMSFPAPRPDEFNSFHDWPVEKQVQAASIIAITKWQKSDSRLKCIITEILKQAPNTTFYYKVGDEYVPGSNQIEDDTIYGDGQVMFFTGSPATFRYSTTYSNDRISGMGDMPITELRDLIRDSKQ